MIMPREFVGSLELRNPRNVFRDGDWYFVEATDRNGKAYTERIPLAAVARVSDALKGRTAVVEDAVGVVSECASELSLPYTHGYKLHYYAQDILLVLVATGRASLKRKGRRFHYRIGG
jgi:hypothetical protein